jgi:protein-S-isoprenylcysteine O-methyltransferase Ste14
VIPDDPSPILDRLDRQQPLRRINGRNNTKADILVYRLDGLQIAVKDYRRRPWWVRGTIGRWMIRRETRSYLAAEDVPGIAHFLGRLGPHSLATEWVESQSLGELRDQAVDEIVFERLQETLERLHDAGIALADLHLSDVLVDANDRITLVDLATAFTLGPRPGSLRSRLFRRLVLQDQISFARLRAHIRKEDADAAVDSLGPEAGRINRRSRWLKKWLDRARGRRHGTQDQGASRQQGPYNKTLGKLRVASVWALVGALAFFSRPTPGSVALGFPFVVLGEILRFWSAGHLHKTVKLITSGPYRHTRNPLYLGRLLILTGLSIMAVLPYHANWGVLGLGYVIFFAYYLPRKERVEPERLHQAHGPLYEAYFEAVPALFPRWTPWPGASNDGWYSSRLLRNREHWMAFALMAITWLLMWRAY